MNNYRNIIGRVNYWLFLVGIFLLPFPQPFLQYAIVSWFVAWSLEGRWLRNPLHIHTSILPILPFILFGAWYIWRGISYFWSPDTAAWAWNMERYLSFLLIVPIGIWGVNEQYNWRHIGLVFVSGCCISVIFYLLFMTMLHCHPAWIELFEMPADWCYYESWRVFFSENISAFKHRLFLSSVELMGAVAALRLFRGKWKILIPSLVLMLSIVALSDSRQSIINMVVLAVMELIFALPEPHKIRRSIAIACAGLILAGTFVALHPKVQEFGLNGISDIRELRYDHDFRFNTWGAALREPANYLAHGVGAGQSTNYLVTQYKAGGIDSYAESRFHVHNQYLEEVIELGLPGLLLFLFAWFSIPLCAPKQNRQIAWLFTVLFMLSMCTDCMFGKFDGIALWDVGLVIIFFQTNTEREEQSARDTETH